MSKKILLLDDDREFCEELAEILQEQGFVVETAYDATGLDGLIEKSAFDAFILDFKLPDINGIQALKKIKQRIPKAKVVMITGRPFISNVLEREKLTGLIAGFLNKPFEIEKLLLTLNSL